MQRQLASLRPPDYLRHVAVLAHGGLKVVLLQSGVVAYLAQDVEYLVELHVVYPLPALGGRTEANLQQLVLLLRRLEFVVHDVDDAEVVLGKDVFAWGCIGQLFHLGPYRIHVDLRIAHVDVLDGEAEVAAVVRVAQEFHLVHAPAEVGYAVLLDAVLGIEHSAAHLVLRDDAFHRVVVLTEDVLHLVVDVDPHLLHQVGGGEVVVQRRFDVARVAVLHQSGRAEEVQERCLVPSLGSGKDEHHVVELLAGHALIAGHEPLGEVFLEQLLIVLALHLAGDVVVELHGVHQLLQLPHPFQLQGGGVVGHGVEALDAGGLQYGAQVVLRLLVAVLLEPIHYVGLGLVVHLLPRVLVAFLLPLHLLAYAVAAEVVAAGEEVVHLRDLRSVLFLLLLLLLLPFLPLGFLLLLFQRVLLYAHFRHWPPPSRNRWERICRPAPTCGAPQAPGPASRWGSPPRRCRRPYPPCL